MTQWQRIILFSSNRMWKKIQFTSMSKVINGQWYVMNKIRQQERKTHERIQKEKCKTMTRLANAQKRAGQHNPVNLRSFHHIIQLTFSPSFATLNRGWFFDWGSLNTSILYKVQTLGSNSQRVERDKKTNLMSQNANKIWWSQEIEKNKN